MTEQPWRNPRPAPLPEEIRQRLAPRSFAPEFLSSWWPAFLWAGFIFSMSTDTFSAAHTGSILYAIFHWLHPGLTEEQFEPLHFFIRKCAHFTEYFVFYVLLFRGVRSARIGWRWTWALAALAIAACYAALDEVHQAFVASRTASAWDSLLDSVGAFVAAIVLYCWFRWRRRSSTSRAAAN